MSLELPSSLLKSWLFENLRSRERERETEASIHKGETTLLSFPTVIKLSSNFHFTLYFVFLHFYFIQISFFIFIFEYSNLVARSVPVVNLGFLCFKLASICFHVFSYDVLGFDLFLYITVIRSQYLQITLDTVFLFNNSKLCHNDSEIA